jgi:hypothetical protein
MSAYSAAAEVDEKRKEKGKKVHEWKLNKQRS